LVIGRPVIKFVAENRGCFSPFELAAIASDEACGLAQNLLISIRSRVMLRKNLWTDTGLVNGALGYICGVVFIDRDRRLANYLLIEFDEYSGPPFLPEHPKVVPIPTFKGDFEHKSKNCTRIQFPIVLAWAITIHKCQGMTLDKAVIDIGKKEMAAGLTFAAISCPTIGRSHILCNTSTIAS
jgi:ATP-dependent exoDNAse (exonuclease V) alpha subunit